MTKLAHITSQPEHQVGDRVLGLCGKEFKVKILWADLPHEKPICRDCVDTALTTLTESEDVLQAARRRALLLEMRMEALRDVINPEQPLLLDEIAARNEAHHQAQEEKRVAKLVEERLAQTCTCTWTSPEIFTEDPNCPIHGGLDAPEGPEIVEPGVGVEDVELPRWEPPADANPSTPTESGGGETP